MSFVVGKGSRATLGSLTGPAGPLPIGSEVELPPLAKIGCFLWLLAFNGAIGGFLFGYDTGSMSSAMLQMKLNQTQGGLAETALTDSQQESITSFVVFGAFLSAITAGKLNECLGRRKVLLLGSIIFVCGAALMAGAVGYPFMIAARLVTGLGVGLCSHSVPLYISECAPAQLRGSLCFLNDMCVVLGQVSAAAVSTGFFYAETEQGWRWILGVATIPSLMMFLGFLVMPESPRWLMMNGRAEEARACLVRLREGASEEDIDAEVREIKASAEDEAGTRPRGPAKYFRDPAIRRPLLLGCGLQLLQQWVGINTIMYYGGSILQKSNGDACDPNGGGGPSDPFSDENKKNVALSILINSAQLFGVLVSWFFVDRAGRRPLLLISLVGLIAALFAMGGVYMMPTPTKAAVVTTMMIYLLLFGVGMSPVPWTINAEIYPLDVRANCISLSTGTNWLMNYVVSQTFLSLAIALSTDKECPNGHPDGVFFLYGFIGLVGLFVSFWGMPETKGKSLEDIAELFKRPGDVPLARSGEGDAAKAAS